MTMKTTFAQIPVDEDTKIKFRKSITVDQFEAMHESWVCEGISAESLIFLTEDLQGMSASALEEMVRTSALVKPESQITISEGTSAFTFVNFNFESF